MREDATEQLEAMSWTKIPVEVTGNHKPCSSLLTVYLNSSKICFIDLAGSERLSSSKSEGIMKKETGNINKSLFMLVSNSVQL